jgi:hypothetical protein
MTSTYRQTDSPLKKVHDCLLFSFFNKKIIKSVMKTKALRPAQLMANFSALVKNNFSF